MLDKKSIIVLKVLKKLLADASYKVVTTQDILTSIQKKDFDSDVIKDIIDYLSKQEYINLKFSEDDTYCYSLLPKGRILLEQDRSKRKDSDFGIKQYALIMLASMLGSLLAMVLLFSFTL